MKDLQLDPPEVTAKANPMAVSVRIKALTMSRARGQRRHDLRMGPQPQYVDEDRICLNRVLLEPRPLATIRDENASLRKEAGRVRAMKSNAAVVTSGIITFGHKAAKLFGSLAPDQQDAAFREVVEAIAARLNTRHEGLVVHLDETALHAHFMLRGYCDDGQPVSMISGKQTMSALQDIAAEVMQRHHAGIERGHRKADRLAAGADFADTLNRCVRQLHEDLPGEIREKEKQAEALRHKASELEVSAAKTRRHMEKLIAQSALNEREEKRLQTYRARLEKKEMELIALDAQLAQEQEALASKEATLTRAESVLFQEKEKVAKDQAETERTRVEAEKEKKRALRAIDQASKVQENYEAGIRAVESVVTEIADGTMHVNPDTGKIRMDNVAVVKAAPRPLRERLMVGAARLVRMIHQTETRQSTLDGMLERVKAWLGREDLTQDAREQGEALRREGPSGMG